jgi:hypothetical protein
MKASQMTTSITKQITTALLKATLCDIAFPLARARENSVMASSTFVARIWERVGDAGDVLSVKVERVAARLGISPTEDVLKPLLYAGEA